MHTHPRTTPILFLPSLRIPPTPRLRTSQHLPKRPATIPSSRPSLPSKTPSLQTLATRLSPTKSTALLPLASLLNPCSPATNPFQSPSSNSRQTNPAQQLLASPTQPPRPPFLSPTTK